MLMLGLKKERYLLISAELILLDEGKILCKKSIEELKRVQGGIRFDLLSNGREFGWKMN